MGQFLLEQGHHKILFLSDNDIGVDHHRWQGLQAAGVEAGIVIKKEQHMILPRKKEERRIFYSRNITKLVKENDALFYSSDYYAAEAIMEFITAGISVPEDISVAGFDDSEFALFPQPQLTTIHQSIRAKAVAAVKMLFACMREDAGIDLREEMDVSLVVRESVKLGK